VATLEQRDILAQTQIAVLGSQLKDRPQAVAVSLWNQERQDGLLVVENLPVLEAGKDYQLWVLDPSIVTPVSAGIFKVDAKGKVRITFKPNQAIANAAKFAVSLEKEGGVSSPTMDQIVMIGGI
jgi:anti-sigma-K factor RskA